MREGATSSMQKLGQAGCGALVTHCADMPGAAVTGCGRVPASLEGVAGMLTVASGRH